MADGVGGWGKKNICSGIFARAMMAGAGRAESMMPPGSVGPQTLLRHAHQATADIQVHALVTLTTRTAAKSKVSALVTLAHQCNANLRLHAAQYVPALSSQRMYMVQGSCAAGALWPRGPLAARYMLQMLPLSIRSVDCRAVAQPAFFVSRAVSCMPSTWETLGFWWCATET